MKLLPIIAVVARKSSKEPDPRSDSYPRDLAQFRQEEKREQFRSLIGGDLQCIPEESRIIGGNLAGALTWRWHAWLPQINCGATVIDSRTILTAGHCCYRHENSFTTGELLDRYEVEVGLTNLNHAPGSTEGNRYRKLYRAQRFVKHPDYRQDAESAENDVCLIFTKKAINMNDGVSPACLPDADIRDPDKNPDFPPFCYTAGFGKYDFFSGLSVNLREMPADVYTNDVCNEKFKHEFGYSVREDSEICAGDITGFNSTCNGDSGSSLICIENEMPVLRGVTSWGVRGCQEEGYPAVFARATKFVSWIKHESKKFMMEANGEDICTDENIPASDCYNGCVVSHIPNWGASSGDKTPIVGGNWVCTDGGNSCNYFCDNNNQDTGIETSCQVNDFGEKQWKEPRNSVLQYGNCIKCNRRDWSLSFKEVLENTDLSVVCDLEDNTSVTCTVWCPTKATGYKLNCNRDSRGSERPWSLNNWRSDDLWTQEDGLKINCNGEEMPSPAEDPNSPEEPNDGSCGAVSHNAGAGGSWVCGEENGKQVCHHTCAGDIKTGISTTCLNGAWTGVSKSSFKKAKCSNCVLSEILAEHPTDGNWNCTNNGPDVVCDLDCSETEHSPEQSSQILCTRKKGIMNQTGPERCDAPPVVEPVCDVASLIKYFADKHPEYGFDEDDWNFSKLSSSGKLGHNCEKNKGKCQIKNGKLSWKVKIKGNLSCPNE